MTLPTTLEFLTLRNTETVVIILNDQEQKINRKHNIPKEHSLCEITMESDETRATIRLEPKNHETSYKIGNIGRIVKLIERIYSTTEYKNNITVLTDNDKQTIHIQYKL